ncbi:unnamed protein product [Brachionus calyciflorus]|uniref:Uncharacterized protein n=1 Tax=Brachionus calyciflorus TaxID=104777 RepID=A0A813PI67_9BILA|nr:unnamed protein product [Brachionus calyciflorus]
MSFPSVLIEYSGAIDLIIDQLEIIKLIFKRNYSNLDLIEKWAENSSFSDSIFQNPYFEKIRNFDFSKQKSLILPSNIDLNHDSLKIFQFYFKKQFQSILKSCSFDDKEKVLNKIIANPFESLKFNTVEIKNNTHGSIKLGNSAILLLSAIFLYNDFTMMINYEQKSYLELILLTKILNELKSEIYNQGTYDVFYNNLIVFKLQDLVLPKLIQDLNYNSENVKALKSKITSVKLNSKKEVQKLEEEIKETINKKSKLVLKTKLSEKYLVKWKRNYSFQVKNTILLEIKKLENLINNVKDSIQDENQAHHLMVDSLRNEIAKYENKSNDLEQLYNSSIENVQIKLEKLKIDSKEINERLKILKEEFEYKSRIVESYREEKALEDKMRVAAKLISNWWITIKYRMIFFR